jgi:prophage antirepressor-like protein
MQLQVFNNCEFGNIRVFEKDGEPWFVGKDIAEVLGYLKPHNAITAHVDYDDTLKQGIMDNIGRIQETLIINESGLYSLVLSSKLPSAKKFKKWITSEVLPSIRKHGMYAKDELLDNPDLLIQVATKLKEEKAARLEAEKKIEVMKPKVAFFDAVADSKTAIEIGSVANVLAIPGLGRNKLFRLLRDKGILKENNEPYRDYIDRGYFRVVEQKYEKGDGSTHINIKTLVYQKGVDYIRKIAQEVV